jgi:hypothetical protein
MSTTIEIWPAERTDIIFPVPEPRSTNCPQRVITLLAGVEGQSVPEFLASTDPDLGAVRALACYSQDEILAAALVAADLRPVTVLGVLSSQHALELVAS